MDHPVQTTLMSQKSTQIAGKSAGKEFQKLVNL